MIDVHRQRRASSAVLGSLCFSIGIAGVSCSTGATDSSASTGDAIDTASSHAGLVTTTVVDVDAEGNRVVKTRMMTPAQMQREAELREQFLRDRQAGIETAALINDWACDWQDPRAVWVYDGPDKSGNRCCITGWGQATFAQLGCGLNYVQTVWAGEVAGYVWGASCSQGVGRYGYYPTMPCGNIDTIWLATCDAHNQCPNSGLACHSDQCYAPNWPDPSLYTAATSAVTANPGGGEGGEWAVSWTNQVNGLAHDSKNWYWIREKKIHVIPLNEDMTHFGDYIADWASYTDASTYLTGGWNVPGNYVGDFHFGDGDFYQGHLFVPIETTVDQDWGQFVAIYNPVASYRVYSLGTAVPTQLMPLQMHFAWLAINPQDGIVFTATTFSGVSSLQTYKIESNLTLTPLGSVPLKWADGQPLTLANEVQGGAFSPNGHLYISVGTHDDLHGVYAVDTDGTLHGRTTAWWDHGPSLGFLFSPDGSEEVEGMDILDMSAYPASGMVGQIHMIKMNLYNWPKNDGLIFHHWKINSPYY